MVIERLLAELEAYRSEYADRGKHDRSGYIDPTDSDLAREEGARQACEETADTFAHLLREFQPQLAALSRVVAAAQAADRENLENIDEDRLHPCDVNDETVRRSLLYGAQADLSEAVAAYAALYPTDVAEAALTMEQASRRP